MQRRTRSNCRALTLIAVFAAIIGGVPVVQVAMEWRNGERIQAMDLFRYSPWAGNIRRYEREMRERSWVAALTRPAVRGVLFEVVGYPGREVVQGRDGWLFYRPEVEYLIGVNRDPGPLVFGARQARGKGFSDALEVIGDFRDRLGERDIQLLVVPVPGKASVYPDRLSARYGGEARFRSPAEDVIVQLRRVGIEVMDLFEVFRRAGDQGVALYLERDTHWTPAGAELAAGAVNDRLRELGWTAGGTNQFFVRGMEVLRRGDMIEMTRISGLKRQYPGEVVTCRQVIDPVFGLLVPGAGARPGTYRSPWTGAEVLVLGDSYSRIYQYAEPRSLGDVRGVSAGEPRLDESRRGRVLLPGSAGFVAHLTRMLGGGVDAIVSDGRGATEVRRRLSVNPEILETKLVVVWVFAERELGLSAWEQVPLPARLDGGE